MTALHYWCPMCGVVWGFCGLSGNATAEGCLCREVGSMTMCDCWVCMYQPKVAAPLAGWTREDEAAFRVWAAENFPTEAHPGVMAWMRRKACL